MSTLPVKIFTSAQVRAIEKAYASEHNGHCYDLMERAGGALVENLLANCATPSEVWIFCGRGNNGGDGYVAGALLLGRGVKVRLFAVGEPHEHTEAATAKEFFISRGGRIETLLPSRDEGRPTAVIDALLGTGISSSPRAPVSEWIAFINKLGSKVFAVDVPSGVNADTGTAPGDCVSADFTVCMLALKPGLFTSDAVDYTGTILFDPLGVDVERYAALSSESRSMGRAGYADIAGQLPVRTRSCNKGDNGKVLIIAGSRGMGGAAVMAGIGALRGGAGLVKIATDPANVPALNSVHPELMTVDFNDQSAVDKALDWCDVAAIGPGLGQSPLAERLLEQVRASERDCILDADALNLLAKSGDDYQDNRILTPHPGEAARLAGQSIEEIEKNRFESAQYLQERYGGIVLLKGAGTVICDKRRLTLISDGSPALATGGAGDLLTGLIAALAAGELSLRQAAVIGACLHAKAGELAASEFGPVGTVPTDLENYLRRLINGRVRA